MSENALDRKVELGRGSTHSPKPEVNSPMRAAELNFAPLYMHNQTWKKLIKIYGHILGILCSILLDIEKPALHKKNNENK